MLRLAFGQPIRVSLSRTAPWKRFNSSVPRPTGSPEAGPLTSTDGGVSNEVVTAPKSVDSATHMPAVSASEETLIETSTTPISEAFPVLTPHAHLTSGLDPNTLPFRIPLDALGANFTEEQYASTLVHGRAIHLPFFHPRTHDIPVASIQFRSHHPQYLDLQENFERRVHRRAIKAWDADPEVVDRWVKYLRRHALGGVGMRVTKWERMPLGVGKTRLADVMERLENPASASADKIKALGDKIVMDELAAMDSTSRTVVPEHQ
ncbi:hypothetical protein BD779DRAFT_1521472 [Infundibulicybe gibba]|nr:hypothetical protein BD779DRAFT_1521472 [Infundibulicybe gibba]